MNGRVNWIPWVLGILAVLISAGVIASVGTYGAVGRLDENLRLFRIEVSGDLARHERQIEALDSKLDLHRQAEDGRGGGP